MAAALSNTQLQVIQQQLTQHPEILQAIRANQGKIGGRQKYASNGPAFQQSPAEVLKSFGIDFPDAGDYQIQVDPQGGVTLKRNNWFQRNADWILPVATIGTGGAANALAGGGAAAGAGPGTSATAGGSAATPFGATGPGIVEGPGIAGVEGASTLGTTAATGFGAALKAALPAIIGGGAGVAGAAIGAHGNTEAAKTQAAAAEKAAQIQADQLDRALSQAKYIYQTQRADQSGYRSSGNNALGALDFGLGLPAPTFDAPPVDPSIANPAPSTGTVPGAVDAKGQPWPGASSAPAGPSPTPSQQRGQTNSPLSTGGGGLVPVRSPDGLVKLIPQTDVPAAMQAGGKRV